MTAKIEGNQLIITMPLDQTGKPSGSGKSTIHATTSGNKETALEVNGKKLVVSVNAYTSNK